MMKGGVADNYWCSFHSSSDHPLGSPSQGDGFFRLTEIQVTYNRCFDRRELVAESG